MIFWVKTEVKKLVYLRRCLFFSHVSTFWIEKLVQNFEKNTLQGAKNPLGMKYVQLFKIVPRFIQRFIFHRYSVYLWLLSLSYLPYERSYIWTGCYTMHPCVCLSITFFWCTIKTILILVHFYEVKIVLSFLSERFISFLVFINSTTILT